MTTPKCKQCSAVFKIVDSDVRFYEETQVPIPLLCPDCRSQLRCLHRNEWSLYRRICDLCKKNIVAMYPVGAPFPVYCQSCFFGDQWSPLDAGREYRSDQPFFAQCADLLRSVPHIAIMNKQSENSDYCNYSYANKNCYLTRGSHYEEDCLYGAYSTRNRDCVDCLWIAHSELLYECMFCKNCYRSVSLDHCEDCNDCFFSRDLKGCKDCLFSANLRQRQYYIFNEPHSKEDYFKKLASYRLDTHEGLQKARRIYLHDMATKYPVRALYQVQCESCEGGSLTNCRNMRHYFFAANSEDCAYGFMMDKATDSLDANYIGYDVSERCYQFIGCLGLFDCIACNACWHGSKLRYCQFCFSCSECFGCVSLQQKSYCILNKQYTKEEYERIIPQITEAMKKSQEWGEFFPATLSPFGYNESMAIDWFSLSREEAMRQGYNWKERNEMSEVKKTIHAKQLPETINEISDEVLDHAIECEQTKRPFRIVKKELDFYKKMRMPLTHFHPEERHRSRIERRHPARLWSRNCAKCTKTIQTTYAPDRPEIVYCEQCYLAAVY
jgi:hypothetical protein